MAAELTHSAIDDGANAEHTPGTTIKGWPFLGVAPQLKQDAPNFLLQCARKHGGITTMRVAGMRCHLLADPNAVDHVLRRHNGNYHKQHFVEKLKPILGDGLVTSNGERWSASRRIIQAMFTARSVDRLLADMDHEISKTADDWTRTTQVRDMVSEPCGLSLRVLARTMFGDLDGQRVEQVVSAVSDIQKYLRDRMWSSVPYPEFLPTPANKSFKQARRTVASVLEELISRLRANGEQGRDLVSTLTHAVDPSSGQKLSERQLRHEAMTIFFAGHETTGNALSWVFYLLSQHPEVQEKVRQEVLEHVPHDETPSVHLLKNLPYTRAVLEETLRLYPPAFWFARTCSRDDVILGRSIKKGDVMIMAPYVTQRLEDLWPDPDTFRPERFLEGSPRHRYAYFPFGGGPRTCPGGHFAMAEMTLIMARVLQRATVEPAAPATGEQEALVTLRPKDGLPVRLQPCTRTIHVEDTHPGENALVDAALRLRKRVFVDLKGWPVNTDEQGREHDQFDTRHTRHIVTVDRGRVVAAARAMPLDQPSLLMDVFPWLIQGERDAYKTRDYWEGARLVADPELSAHDSRHYLAKLLYDTISRFHAEGVTALLTVSDPVMERVLKRVGANPQRLGPVKRDDHGFPVLALYLPCNQTTLDQLAGRAAPDRQPVEAPAAAA
ncbi:Cytochrome P450 [Limimonas halophila]|uniref:Cytochrome P450 n=1 Tax=Limimonas halophila TaxID=1082479 RepID=A0A1G7S619_9PROT|nr:cytochrome P450 [Limimonas halophila]SDG18431.1 Cytochrome P450 [Limimonas halophila]